MSQRRIGTRRDVTVQVMAAICPSACYIRYQTVWINEVRTFAAKSQFAAYTFHFDLSYLTTYFSFIQ